MRRVALGVAAILAAVIVFIPVGTVAQSGRPNIVLIMVDELSVSILDTMLAAGMLPNIKSSIVDVGYKFTEAYTTRALGVPSRATSLTGLYAHNHGVLGHLNDTGIGGISRFNDTSTVATWLKRGGYRTGYIGKYLSGYGTHTAPTYVPPGWDFWTGTLEPNYHSIDQYALNYNGTVIDFAPLNEQTGGAYYQTDVLSALAGNFIMTAPTFLRPFFLYLAPPNINMEIPFQNECPDASAPLWGGNFWGATGRPPGRHRDTIFGNLIDFAVPQPPSFNEADLSDKPEWLTLFPELTSTDIDCLQRNYWRRLEMLRSVDEMVGYVFQRLQAIGALANTAVVLTSDNGLYLGEHRLGEKSSAYEESIRIPLYIRAPHTTTPRTVSKIVLNNDLASTIAAYAQVLPGHTPDGRSLLPVIQNPDIASWRKIFLVEHWLEAAVIPTTAPTLAAVRTNTPTPRLLVRYPDVTVPPTAEFYDLAVDPYELENRITDPARAQEIAKLDVWLNALRGCRGLTCLFYENVF